MGVFLGQCPLQSGIGNMLMGMLPDIISEQQRPLLMPTTGPANMHMGALFARLLSKVPLAQISVRLPPNIGP